MIDVKVLLQGTKGEKTKGLKAARKAVDSYRIAMTEEQIRQLHILMRSDSCLCLRMTSRDFPWRRGRFRAIGGKIDGCKRTILLRRSKVWRYRLDNRTHSLTGYNIFLSGTAEGEEKKFVVAVSEKQQMKIGCYIGDVISGTGWTKKYLDLEYADYYRAGSLKKLKKSPMAHASDGKPWTDEVPELSVYDWRGCRMLDRICWSKKCFTCK